MASKKPAGGENTGTTVETPVKVKPAVTYTVEEFAKAAKAVFGEGTTPDLVIAAFRVNGTESATVEEAKKLVKAFAEKEVVK